MTPSLELQLEGRYTLVKQAADGTRTQVADFPNLITNGGLDYIASNDSIAGAVTWCSVGTGTNPPAVTDVGLQTFVARTTTPATADAYTSNSSDPARPYVQLVRARRFAAGAAAGNLTEVGMFSAGNNTSAFSRALILDGSGNPTAITVLPTEILDVYYTVRMYIPTADVTGTITVNGNNHDYVLRPYIPSGTVSNAAINCSSPTSRSGGSVWTGLTNLNAWDTAVSGSGLVNATAHTPAAYVTGTYYRDNTSTLPVGAGSPQVAAYQQGIGRVGVCGPSYFYKMSFTPPIPVGASQQFAITTRVHVARTTP